MEKNPSYLNSLRKHIEMAGYTFKEVAQKASISQRTLYYWASGHRIIPHQDRAVLAQILGCSTEDLMPQQNSPDMVQWTHDSNEAWEQGEMNTKRRELLRLLSLACSILILPDVDWERVDRVIYTPSFLDQSGINDLEAINHHYWRIYCASPIKSAVLDGVLGQLKILVKLLQTSSSTQVRSALNVLACDLAQLAGEIFLDNNDYNTAQSCYTFAVTTAKEATHYDLWACALVRNAFLPIYNEQHLDALPLLYQAKRIVTQGNTSLVTRYWIEAVLAQAYADIGNLSACQKAMDTAEEVRNMKYSENGGWLRFDETRLSEQRGTCFVHLKQPGLAIAPLHEALAQHSAPSRRKGMILNELALASLQQLDVEQACTYAHEVISIALQSSSGLLKKGLAVLRPQLESFSETDAVKQLDQHLKLLV